MALESSILTILSIPPKSVERGRIFWGQGSQGSSPCQVRGSRASPFRLVRLGQKCLENLPRNDESRKVQHCLFLDQFLKCVRQQKLVSNFLEKIIFCNLKQFFQIPLSLLHLLAGSCPEQKLSGGRVERKSTSQLVSSHQRQRTETRLQGWIAATANLFLLNDTSTNDTSTNNTSTYDTSTNDDWVDEFHLDLEYLIPSTLLNIHYIDKKLVDFKANYKPLIYGSLFYFKKSPFDSTV